MITLFQQSIDYLRASNGKKPIEKYDGLMSCYCERHSKAMARMDLVYHADYDNLEGWMEAVGCHDMIPNRYDAVHAIIFTLFGRSDKHRDILIYSNQMAVGVAESLSRIYVTIRGK